jgi:hypothetical protein
VRIHKQKKKNRITHATQESIMVSSPEEEKKENNNNNRTSQIKKHYVYMRGLLFFSDKEKKEGFTKTKTCFFLCS